MKSRPWEVSCESLGSFLSKIEEDYFGTMEVVLGLALFSAGMALTGHLYHQLVHPHHPSCKVAYPPLARDK